MPVWLIPLGIGAAVTFFSTQLDDLVDKPQIPQGIHLPSNAVEWAMWAAAGMGLYWLANKSGVLKAI